MVVSLTRLAAQPAVARGQDEATAEVPAGPVCVTEYSISAAAIAIFSLIFIIMGTICVLLSFTKKRDYLLRPASMFYAFAGRGGALACEPGPGARCPG